MKVYYDDEVDALYFEFGEQTPDGVVEIAEGVQLDTTEDGKLTGIEILSASKKINLNTFLTYSLKIDKDLMERKIA